MKKFKVLFLLIAFMVNSAVHSSEDVESPKNIKSPEDIIIQMRAQSFDAFREVFNECHCLSMEEGYMRLNKIRDMYDPIWENIDKKERRRLWSDFFNETDEDGNDVVMALLKKAYESEKKSSFCVFMAKDFYKAQKESFFRLNEQ